MKDSEAFYQHTTVPLSFLDEVIPDLVGKETIFFPATFSGGIEGIFHRDGTYYVFGPGEDDFHTFKPNWIVAEVEKLGAQYKLKLTSKGNWLCSFSLNKRRRRTRATLMRYGAI